MDADTGLIVHHAVTNEPNDTRQLHPMAKAAKEALGFERLTVVADAGYSNGAAAAACEADGITACAPTNRSVNNQGDGALFDRSEPLRGFATHLERIVEADRKRV